MRYIEANFDGLPGNTHNYAGLSTGNLASQLNSKGVSNPRAALFQALDKAKYLADAGLAQYVVPPQERPSISTLRALGYTGTPPEILEKVARENPSLLAQVSSASSMWEANAGTVIPSVDSEDGRLHFCTASLGDKPHRSLEGNTTADINSRIFGPLTSSDQAQVHAPLPLHPKWGDEGAANHMRFANSYGEPGTHVFVYGKSSIPGSLAPKKFTARQSLEASQAIARLGRLAVGEGGRTIFVQQNPAVIDAGVFHNDVISINNLGVWLFHEAAYLNPEHLIADIQASMRGNLSIVMAKSSELSLQNAIDSYVFNSQIVSLPDGTMRIIAPSNVESNPQAKAYIERVIADGSNPITSVKYFDLNQSMQNGGGPACLRLRVVLSDREQEVLNGSAGSTRVFMTDDLYKDLYAWGNKWYRESLPQPDLADPQLYAETCGALDELTSILKLGGNLYDFQRPGA